MSRSRRGAPAPVDPSHLEKLATMLLDAVALERGDPPRLVRLRAGADDLADGELELGLLELDDGAHPLEALVRFDAPEDWVAAGVLATGRATRLSDGEPAGPFPVRSAHLVARSGAWAAAWRRLGGGSRGVESGADAPGPCPSGRIDDALRRCVGLPTAPPAGGTQRLWATQWLDAVIERVAMAEAGGAEPATPAAVLALHPAVTAFDLDPGALDLQTVVAEAERLATVRTWGPLRHACGSGLWTHPVVDAATAAWLDDGAFARWVLGSWPELEDLHDTVSVLLGRDAVALVDAALAAWQSQLRWTERA